ncbi:hypothetical protein BKA70DRAFT_1423707 [Coprinopsis sp. MPI-PUGE-AT-0042]|nr:hypothetical protein BKA70DRAFT_1423707 [Coprinopsis sp. MPI-PUGE-AT-0042]
MDYHDQPRGEDTYAYSPNDAYIRGYPYGWGNFPDPYSLPSYVHTQSSHDDYRYDVFKHGDLATAGAPGGYDTERHPPTTPARLASGTGDQPKARRRYTRKRTRNGALSAKLSGITTGPPLEGDKPLSMLFEDDPSLYLEAALPQIPEDFDGLTIGSFVGNLNSGLLGEKGELVMTYKPQRVLAAEASSPHTDLPCFPPRARKRPPALCQYTGKSKALVKLPVPNDGLSFQERHVRFNDCNPQPGRTAPELFGRPTYLILACSSSGRGKRYQSCCLGRLTSARLTTHRPGQRPLGSYAQCRARCTLDKSGPRRRITPSQQDRLPLDQPLDEILLTFLRLQEFSHFVLAIAVGRLDVTDKQQEACNGRQLVGFLVHENLETALDRACCEPVPPPLPILPTSLYYTRVLFSVECETSRQLGPALEFDTSPHIIPSSTSY